jgi:hypothetical protein
MTIIEKVQSIHNMESRIIELLKNAEDKYKKIRNNRELDELDKMKGKFKEGQIVKRGGYSCKYIVIGYKFENYLLAVKEGEKDVFTNRELLYDKHLYID